MSDGTEVTGSIKVVDRRRFTEDGRLRPDRPAAASAPVPSTSEPSEHTSSEPPQSPPPPTSPAFLELVRMLAQQADLLLNGAPGLPPQPDQAQIFVDFLAVLESKTRGNLSTEESQVVSRLLFQLRSMAARRGA